jgi:hypothetical protein
MQVDKHDQRYAAIRRFTLELGEQLVLKIRHSPHPETEWKKALTELSRLAAYTGTAWYCILPNNPIKGPDCPQIDPSACLSLGGTPTTANCGGSAPATYAATSGQTTGSIE